MEGVGKKATTRQLKSAFGILAGIIILNKFGVLCSLFSNRGREIKRAYSSGSLLYYPPEPKLLVILDLVEALLQHVQA